MDNRAVEATINDSNRYQFGVGNILVADAVLEGIASGTDAGGFSAIIRPPLHPDGHQPQPIADLGEFSSLRAAKAALRKWATRNKGELTWIL